MRDLLDLEGRAVSCWGLEFRFKGLGLHGLQSRGEVRRRLNMV